MELTAVFKKVSEGYIAWVEDLPVRATALPRAAVHRHTEINDILARKICRDLQIPAPH